jgi:hypothetical protein
MDGAERDGAQQDETGFPVGLEQFERKRGVVEAKAADLPDQMARIDQNPA